ncbi:hypothetical protein CBER1_06706 [Cercospora berteroae]|uniref:DUF7726 domain-containing protein n=1 Tax=Cercospora berteroae TaxID=357750 RepID=A0A2S6CNI0_9PEZI|nr:hypothetical protein CBER1_06706 [Cercospora berteroae]
MQLSRQPRKVLGDVTSLLANEPTQRAQERPTEKDARAEAARAYFATGDYQAYLKATGKKSTTAGTKRKAQEAPLADPDDFDVEDMAMDKSCNQVRGMIRRFLDSGEMKKGEFGNAIGVAPNSLNRFLAQNGSMDGAGSSVYGNAWMFFKKRELAGIKAPKKAKATASTSTSASAFGAGSSTAAPATADITTIYLPGEESGSVRIYDTCDEIRKKINAYLTKPGVTQASFCRDLAAQNPTGANIQSKQLTDFRSKKGARQGNTSCVFYSAYVFFEKLRLAEGKPKSKHRQEMEEVWASQGGFDIVHGGHRGFLCPSHMRPYEDKLGRIRLG